MKNTAVSVFGDPCCEQEILMTMKHNMENADAKM
jgi:hypothetical protein